MLKPHKVLYINTGAFLSDGGIATLNRLTLYTLACAGHSITIFSLSEVRPYIDERYFLNQVPARVFAFGGKKYSFSTAVWLEVLTHRYDLIMVDHVNLASILAPLSWLRICRYVVWLCGVEVFPPRPDWEGGLGLKNAYKRIAISQYTSENVRHRFPDLPIEVCDLGLDPLHWTETGEDAGFAALEFESINGEKSILGKRIILHVGRMASLERYKGQETLLRAFPLVKKDFPEAQLILVGQGDDRERLLAVARSLPEIIQDSIFMPGFIASEQLHQLYQSCFVFAMPSIGEGFGLVYLEAMARAKPCIGGNVDAAPYVIKDSVTGFLVDDPKNHVQVAASLLRFFNDPQKAEAMGRAGYDLVKSYYLPEHFAKRFWQALGMVA